MVTLNDRVLKLSLVSGKGEVSEQAGVLVSRSLTLPSAPL